MLEILGRKESVRHVLNYMFESHNTKERICSTGPLNRQEEWMNEQRMMCLCSVGVGVLLLAATELTDVELNCKCQKEFREIQVGKREPTSSSLPSRMYPSQRPDWPGLLEIAAYRRPAPNWVVSAGSIFDSFLRSSNFRTTAADFFFSSSPSAAAWVVFASFVETGCA